MTNQAKRRAESEVEKSRKNCSILSIKDNNY